MVNEEFLKQLERWQRSKAVIYPDTAEISVLGTFKGSERWCHQTVLGYMRRRGLIQNEIV
jgi:hypothetical protein